MSNFFLEKSHSDKTLSNLSRLWKYTGSNMNQSDYFYSFKEKLKTGFGSGVDEPTYLNNI